MKKQISLRLFITLTFLALIVLFVVCYSVLSRYFHIRQLHHVTHSNMEKAAQIYLKVISKEHRGKAREFGEYIVTDDRQQLPPEIQTVIEGSETSENFLVKKEHSGWLRPPESISFLYRFSEDGKDYFMTRRVTKPSHLSSVAKNSADNRHLFFLITTCIVGFLGIVILLIVQRVFRPITALNQWTRTLDTKSLNSPPPDFSYPELNELAGLIQTSLSSVQAGLEREHAFLRHASHELRTPIAIIQNNIELLHKLEETNTPAQQKMKDSVIERISRAGMNMQQLTETLLWLSKKEIGSLPDSEVELESLIRELAEELKYLLERKDVRLKVSTSPCILRLPEFPLRIVLGNLIRNSFQHILEGDITIEQHNNRITISNSRPPAESSESDLGFGLGLQLTAQLAEKLRWHYSNDVEGSINIARLELQNEHTSGSGSGL